jgi:hypothetical protein
MLIAFDLETSGLHPSDADMRGIDKHQASQLIDSYKSQG